ncbi:syntaxin-binding protein 4 isoform X8 [Bubalus kerabau]|uniref:syntaxin-binding protein 4 isoform X8 n=1 Tax=Bubalus carabanensis TaxID=3119969 RepID=UPI00244EC23D|nr:syntaxin-binding protein 4 isoform X8 [Bubalus carabanensis]
MNKNTSSVVSSSLLEKDPAFQMITVTKKTGLGLKILGGINRNEGPLVYIQEIIPGGDCYKDGRLKPGDQLVSVNKESMIGVSFEEAKSIITRAKLRSESSWEIAFIRQKSDSSHLENPSCSSLLQATGEYGPQASKFSLISSPETLIPKTSSTPRSTDAILPSFRRNQIKTGYKKTEQIPITSSDNSPTDMSNTDIAPAWTDSYGPQGKKISLNPSVRIKVEKLEMALNYLGIQPTKEQHQALRQQVQVDTKGTVSFGDFVHVARNLFCLQLDEANVGAHEISSILNSQISQETGDSLETDEMEKLKHERNNALEQVKTLKEKLFESERQRKQLTEELQNVKQARAFSGCRSRGCCSSPSSPVQSLPSHLLWRKQGCSSHPRGRFHCCLSSCCGGSRGCCSSRPRGCSHCRPFSCCGARALRRLGSVAATGRQALEQTHWLWLLGLVTPRHVGSSHTRDPTCNPHIDWQILNHWTTREVQEKTV